MVKLETDLTKVGKKFVSNAVAVLDSIKDDVPGISDAQICAWAGIHSQTLARWRKSGKADLGAMKKLVSGVESHLRARNSFDLTPVSDWRLRCECQRRGWNCVIDAKEEVTHAC